MMLQIKLFRVFDNTKDQTIKDLQEAFGEENIININNNIVGVSYNYSDRGYRYILSKIKNIDVKQFIITSNLFFDLIDYCVNNQLFIKRINFADSIEEEHSEFIREYLSKVNSRTNNIYENKKFLLDELNWITSDESIDIKTTSFTIEKSNNSIRFFEVELFHNGVIYINNQIVLAETIDVLNTIIG